MANDMILTRQNMTHLTNERRLFDMQNVYIRGHYSQTISTTTFDMNA
jgi:hypothetical protein